MVGEGYSILFTTMHFRFTICSSLSFIFWGKSHRIFGHNLIFIYSYWNKNMSHFFRSATLLWMDKYKCQEYEEHSSNFQNASQSQKWYLVIMIKIILRHRPWLDWGIRIRFWLRSSEKCDLWGQTWRIGTVTTIWHPPVKMTHGNTILNNGPNILNTLKWTEDKILLSPKSKYYI